ncbi:MAG: c-type cytochrome [Acidobacteria bacterium]|nr:c-type cytochrome [Acidobacteriota bacterium]
MKRRRIGSVVCVMWLLFALQTAAVNVKSQGSPPDKPAEQTFKNIQVLKGLPSSQLYPVMWFIRDSLGVHCDYCHVKQGTDLDKGWTWESDDKPQKVRAREMMRMVLDVNRATFGGGQAVTCYSCHRGSTDVARAVPLPPLAFTSTEAAGKGGALPTAEQILSRYVAAVGGRDAASKFGATLLKGTLERRVGSKGKIEIATSEIEVVVKAPDKYLRTMKTPQGVTAHGLNGAVGWIRNNNDSRRASAEELARLRSAAALYDAVKVTEPPAQLRVIGTEKIGDRETYVVALTVDPKTTKLYFFDTQTGLLLRQTTNTSTMIAPLAEQVDFEDYREVDGVKLPFTLRTSDVDAFSPSTRRFTEIKHSGAVDDAVFNMPAAPK